MKKFIFNLILLFLIAAEVQMVLSELIPIAGVTIKPSANSTNCVRTIAYEWEGAIMKLVDCEKEYMYYDGAKSHTLYKSDLSPGVQLYTVWAPAPDAYGIAGCLYPKKSENFTYVRTKSCYVGGDPIWDFLRPIEAEGSMYMWKHISTGNCVRPAVVNSNESPLEVVRCDRTDTTQLWHVEFN